MIDSVPDAQTLDADVDWIDGTGTRWPLPRAQQRILAMALQ
jgi:hypothetical protein